MAQSRRETAADRAATVTVQRLALADLRDHPRNPRRHPDPGTPAWEALRVSLAHDYFDPLVVNLRPGPEERTLVSGHLRRRILAAEGYTHADCVVVNYDSATHLARLLAANRLQGENVDVDVGALLRDLQAFPDDLLLTGYTADDVAGMLADLAPPPPPPVDDPGPSDPPAQPVCRTGDLWTIGPHRLLCGDCATDSTALFGNQRWAMLVSDPPYGVDYAGKNAFLNSLDGGNRIETAIEHDAAPPTEMATFWVRTFRAVVAFGLPGAAYYITGPAGGELMMMMQSLIQAGLQLKHMLIWVKQQFVLGRCDYHYRHEPILYGWVPGAHRWYGGHGQDSIWEIDRPRVSDLHPTMKPVELYARAMRNSSVAGEIVCDPFAGSGTAYVAAQQEGRVCYGMEIDPAYCDVILRRVQEVAGVDAVRHGDGRRFSDLAIDN